LENSAVNDYWTEKLSDAFLAACHPIYYGCPNINRYFDPASLTLIDLDHPEKAMAVIESCIEQKRYESSEQKIWEAREKVLDTHNVFALIADYIENDQRSEGDRPCRPVKITIRKEPSDSNLIYRFRKKLLRL
nr:hypothetical protein [Smithella sp.]